MNVPALVLSIVGIVVLYAAVVLAWFATKPGHHWLVVGGAVPIVGALGFSLADVPVTHPAFGLLAAAGFVLLGTIGGSGFVSLVLDLATRDTVTLGAHGGIMVMSTVPVREILRGGAAIGYLERIALIGSVLAGQPAAVAVIVAIKGLGRFSELENATARERFIIGTLASLLWAGACTAAIAVGR
ncbi:MAG: hypothetical protein JWM50_1833 [Microbacteriaceae bacterium]|jgi:hypothetical protein|nr:hypothetical protein [Microbacteriaceae bacterium]